MSPAIYLSPAILFQYYELTSSRGAGNTERVKSLTHCCASNCSYLPCKARWLGGPSPDAPFPGQPATGGLSWKLSLCQIEGVPERPFFVSGQEELEDGRILELCYGCSKHSEY